MVDVLHSPTTYLDGPPRRLLDPLCNLLVDTRVNLALRTAIVKAGAIDALMRVVVSSNYDYSVALRLHGLLGSPIMAQYAPLSVEAPDATVAEMQDEVQRSMDGLPRLGEHWVLEMEPVVISRAERVLHAAGGSAPRPPRA